MCDISVSHGGSKEGGCIFFVEGNELCVYIFRGEERGLVHFQTLRVCGHALILHRCFLGCYLLYKSIYPAYSIEQPWVATMTNDQQSNQPPATSHHPSPPNTIHYAPSSFPPPPPPPVSAPLPPSLHRLRLPFYPPTSSRFLLATIRPPLSP